MNLYLIGMPGSGKSTIGRCLSKALAVPFIDCDEEFSVVTGMAPSECISKEGEASFRDKESRILADLSKKDGFVIATGGGVIIREENRKILKETGKVIYIVRPLEELPTYGRILSQRESVEKLFEKRKQFYEETADITVISTDPEIMTEKILAQTGDLLPKSKTNQEKKLL